MTGVTAAYSLLAQNPPPPQQQQAISLADAVAGGRQHAGQVQTANIALLIAREDRTQARALALPSVNAQNQMIYTQANGTPEGVFIANNAVHEYVEQATVHEEVLSVFRRGEVRRAAAAEAVARARVAIASRGIDAAVVQDYYAIVLAQRRLANARVTLGEAQQFLDISRKLEAGGEAAHADVVKAQIQVQQRQRDFDDATLAAEKARIALGVLIFPALNTAFRVIDDLDQPELLAPFDEARAKALMTSPDVVAARSGLNLAAYDVSVARYAWLPSLALDFGYGVDSNRLAWRREEDGEQRRNVGYAAQATLNIPLWNWGVTRSKVKQAELRRTQAQLDLSLTQRTLEGNVAAAHAEARAALAQIESLRTSSSLSIESLRLTILRYQAGEATALEVADAQTTLAQARNALDDGLARHRVAAALVRILTGGF